MQNQRSVMKHQFSEVPAVEIPRSSFDRSHAWKGTFDAGYLIPIFVDEALPGDTFNLDMTGFARLATPIFPIMDNMFMETFFFAVPNRLVWDNWQKFNGEQASPGASTDFVIPKLDVPAGGYANGSLPDYMGIPTAVEISVNALHFRAFNLIWNEWFRDQNIQTPLTVETDDGPDSNSIYALRRRGKRHDYFTSCLPWPQKGDAVGIGLGTDAPVIRATTAVGPEWEPAGGGTTMALGGNTDGTTYLNPPIAVQGPIVWGNTRLLTDLSGESFTINALREAFQVQRLLERDARGGSRYTEIIRSHFGVTSPDARLQRPEYLGGGSSPVIISPVAQTSATDAAVTPQANLSAIGTASLHNHGFTKSFTEHCVLIGLISVRADLTYQQGLNKMWSRVSRYDYFWPALAHLGEQTVLNREIMAEGTGGNDDVVFGYQERYAEYRYKPSVITGKFRSNSGSGLDAWHLSQDFQSVPLLNTAFIEDTPPVDRIIAVQDEPHFIFDAYFNMRCARPMPLYGVPGLIDHF